MSAAEQVAVEPDVFAAEHRIPWGALAPYAPLADFDGEAPESESEVESTDYFPVTLAGHKWISDRYMLIRTELLSGEPMSSQYPSTWPAEGVTAALQKVLDQARVAGNPQALNPYYVLLAERAGWTLEPAERLWRIVLDGAIVGAVVGLRDGADGGRRPGDDLTRIREVVKYLPGHNPQAYIAGARIVDALDALDSAPETPEPAGGMPVHNHGPWEGPGTDCAERHLMDGALRGACIPTDIPTRTWTPNEDLPGGGRRITVKRFCSGCSEVLGDPNQAELDALATGAPLPSTTEEHGCQR